VPAVVYVQYYVVVQPTVHLVPHCTNRGAGDLTVCDAVLQVIVKAEGYAPLAKLVAVPEIRHQEGERSFTGWMTLYPRTAQGRIFKERAALERIACEKIIHD
jgi:hypothetical protein